MLKRLKRWWHRWNREESFRCVYNPDERTRRMTYRVADNYRQIFGGEVIFDPREK